MRITIIEGMVIFVIILILTSTAYQVATGAARQASATQIGPLGITETRCIEGYKFVLGSDGNPRQILDEFGKGTRCEQKFTK